MIAGEREDFIQAEPFFEASAADTERSREEVLEACCVMARAARLTRGCSRYFEIYFKGAGRRSKFGDLL